jgi:hypothetical protein
MPAQSFGLIIDGSLRESLFAFENLKYAADMQEAMLEQDRLAVVKILGHPSLCSDLELPCYVPRGFSEAIQGMMDGTSNISFTGYVGEMWDQAAFFYERGHWTVQD